jgi:hypothetical protein
LPNSIFSAMISNYTALSQAHAKYRSLGKKKRRGEFCASQLGRFGVGRKRHEDVK